MAQIVCVREGRMGFHIGDVVELPDDVEVIDTTYFRRVTDDEIEKARKHREELEAEAERLAAEAEAARNAANAENDADNVGESN